MKHLIHVAYLSVSLILLVTVVFPSAWALRPLEEEDTLQAVWTPQGTATLKQLKAEFNSSTNHSAEEHSNSGLRRVATSLLSGYTLENKSTAPFMEYQIETVGACKFKILPKEECNQIANQQSMSGPVELLETPPSTKKVSAPGGCFYMAETSTWYWNDPKVKKTKGPCSAKKLCYCSDQAPNTAAEVDLCTSTTGLPNDKVPCRCGAQTKNVCKWGQVCTAWSDTDSECEMMATCENYTGCDEETHINRGRRARCPGKESTCTSKVCCEAEYLKLEYPRVLCPKGYRPATEKECERFPMGYAYLGGMKNVADWINGCFEWYKEDDKGEGGKAKGSGKLFYNNRPGSGGNRAKIGGNRICRSNLVSVGAERKKIEAKIVLQEKQWNEQWSQGDLEATDKSYIEDNLKKHPEFSFIDANKACEKNDEKIERARAMKLQWTTKNRSHALDVCMSTCTAECAGIDFYALQGRCVYYERACQNPLREVAGAMSFKRPEAKMIEDMHKDRVIHPFLKGCDKIEDPSICCRRLDGRMDEYVQINGEVVLLGGQKCIPAVRGGHFTDGHTCAPQCFVDGKCSINSIKPEPQGSRVAKCEDVMQWYDMADQHGYEVSVKHLRPEVLPSTRLRELRGIWKKPEEEGWTYQVRIDPTTFSDAEVSVEFKLLTFAPVESNRVIFGTGQAVKDHIGMMGTVRYDGEWLGDTFFGKAVNRAEIEGKLPMWPGSYGMWFKFDKLGVTVAQRGYSYAFRLNMQEPYPTDSGPQDYFEGVYSAWGNIVNVWLHRGDFPEGETGINPKLFFRLLRVGSRDVDFGIYADTMGSAQVATGEWEDKTFIITKWLSDVPWLNPGTVRLEFGGQTSFGEPYVEVTMDQSGNKFKMYAVWYDAEAAKSQGEDLKTIQDSVGFKNSTLGTQDEVPPPNQDMMSRCCKHGREWAYTHLEAKVEESIKQGNQGSLKQYHQDLWECLGGDACNGLPCFIRISRPAMREALGVSPPVFRGAEHDRIKKALETSDFAMDSTGTLLKNGQNFTKEDVTCMLFPFMLTREMYMKRLIELEANHSQDPAIENIEIKQTRGAIQELKDCSTNFELLLGGCFSRENTWALVAASPSGPWQHRLMADLRAGDYVLAMDEARAAVFADRVAINFHLRDQSLYPMIEIWHSLGKLTVTPDHVLFVSGTYQAARHVRHGQWLLVARPSQTRSGGHSLEADFGAQNVSVTHVVTSFGHIVNPLTHSGRILAVGFDHQVTDGKEPVAVGVLASTVIESPGNVMITMCTMPSFHKLSSWLFPKAFQDSWLIEETAMAVAPWQRGMAFVVLYDTAVGLTFLMWHSGLLSLLVGWACLSAVRALKQSKRTV